MRKRYPFLKAKTRIKEKAWEIFRAFSRFEISNETKLVVNIFTLKDYKVLSTEGGIEALKLLDENRVDLILTDILMPDIEGIEFIRQVKEEKKLSVKTIAMSGSGIEGDYLNLALKNGADSVIGKPFTITFLLQTVHQVSEKN